MDLDWSARINFFDESTEMILETKNMMHIPRQGEIVMCSVVASKKLFVGEVVAVQYTLLGSMVGTQAHNAGSRGPFVDIMLRERAGIFGKIHADAAEAAAHIIQRNTEDFPILKDPTFLRWFREHPDQRADSIESMVRAYNTYKEEKDGETQGREAREDRPEDGGPYPIDDGD